jgi:hypothetical protein
MTTKAWVAGTSYYDSAFDYAGGNGMQVAVDITWSIPSHTSTSVTATVKYYTDNQYAYSDAQTLNFTGAITGSYSYTNNQGSSEVLRTTRTYTYNYPAGSYYTSPGTITIGANVSGTYNGSNPVINVTGITIPARPAIVPSAPTSFAVVKGVTDNTLSWSAPLDNGGVAVTGYVLNRNSTLIYSGTNTSFTDTGLTPLTNYSYTVSAINIIGTGTAASLSTTTIGGVVNIIPSIGANPIKVLPKVWNGSAWVDGNARIYDGIGATEADKWKYGT